MATYKYSAISKDGERVSGVLEAYNELSAVEQIKQTCNVVLKITEVNEESGGFLNMEIGGNKLDAKAFTVMCSQFAIILKAGIPIARTVHLIADKTTNKPLKKILTQVAEDVESGRSLATSFEQRGGKILPATFIETIRSGEESGNIDRAFESMYAHFDKQIKIRGKIKSALAYPLFVLVLAVVVVIVLMVKVVPTFTEMFAEMGGELPLITRILIGISNFFRHYILVMIAVVALIVLAYKLYGNTESGRMNLAKLALKVPIMGNIALLNASTQFANTMTTMLGAGLPLTKAITITSKVIDNYHISQEVGKMAALLEEGKSLGPSLRESGCLPDILTDMVAVGEETGEMEETLSTIGDYYYTELEQATDAAVKKLEPALLVGLAGIAGFIVIAIYMSIFSLYSIM